MQIKLLDLLEFQLIRVKTLIRTQYDNLNRYESNSE